MLHDGLYDIRVRSTLDDAPLTTISYDFVILEIDDGCESDVVSLVSGISD